MLDSIYKAKDDVVFDALGTTLPKDTVVIVTEFSEGRVTFSPVPLLKYMSVSCSEEAFLRLFERS